MMIKVLENKSNTKRKTDKTGNTMRAPTTFARGDSHERDVDDDVDGDMEEEILEEYEESDCEEEYVFESVDRDSSLAELDFDHEYEEEVSVSCYDDTADLFDSIRSSMEAHKRDLDSSNVSVVSPGGAFSRKSVNKAMLPESMRRPSKPSVHKGMLPSKLNKRRESNISMFSEYTLTDDDEETIEEELLPDVDKSFETPVLSDDEYEEQVVERWFGRDEEPDDLEAACRKLISIVYKDDKDVDPDRMIKRSPLPELYKYLKQHYDYKIYSDKEETVEEPIETQKSLGDIFKMRIGGPSVTPGRANASCSPGERSKKTQVTKTGAYARGAPEIEADSVIEEEVSFHKVNEVIEDGSDHSEDENLELIIEEVPIASYSEKDSVETEDHSRIYSDCTYSFETVEEDSDSSESTVEEQSVSSASSTSSPLAPRVPDNKDAVFRRASAIMLGEFQSAVSTSFATYNSDEDVDDEWEFDEQVVERWVGRNEVPDDYEAACRALIANLYKPGEADAEKMMRRTPLPELYNYLKQEAWYRFHQNDTNKAEIEAVQEKPERSAPSRHQRPNTPDTIEELVEEEESSESSEEEIELEEFAPEDGQNDESIVEEELYEEEEVVEHEEEVLGDEDLIKSIRASLLDCAREQSERSEVYEDVIVEDDLQGSFYSIASHYEEEEVVISDSEHESSRRRGSL